MQIAALALCVTLAACGGSDDYDSEPARREPVTRHTASPSPDAGIPKGHAPRFWAHCARIAR